MFSGDDLTYNPFPPDPGQKRFDATVQYAIQSKVLKEIHKSNLIVNRLFLGCQKEITCRFLWASIDVILLICISHEFR